MKLIDGVNITNKTSRENLRVANSIKTKDGITKEYISNEKRVIISNEEEVKLNLQLESDYEVATISKNDALIAWFDLKDFSGETLVDNIKFYDVNDNYKELNKDYTFKYQTIGNVPVYKENEKEPEMVEGNIWVAFNSLSELPNKNIKIGLFTDIKIGDKIEWVIEKDGFSIPEWALVIGTNCGFVAVAPTGDPSGLSSLRVDGQGSMAIPDTSPSGAIKVTEIGFWQDNSAVQDNDFQLGIYTDNSGSPGSKVGHVSGTINSQGNQWIKLECDIEISEDTDYWIAIQVDEGSVSWQIKADYQNLGINRSIDDSYYGLKSLQSTWSEESTSGVIIAIYAICEAAAPPPVVVTPDAIASTLTLLAPTVTLSPIISPAVLALTGTLQTPTYAFDFKHAVATQALTGTLQTPTYAFDFKHAVAAQALTATVQTPTYAFDCNRACYFSRCTGSSYKRGNSDLCFRFQTRCCSTSFKPFHSSAHRSF